MATVSKSALVPYQAAEMYRLVNDIESYPRFLPWCRATRVLSRDEDEIRASIEIYKGGINRWFTTRNRLQPDKMIEIRLLDGPFRRLEGYWHFQALGESACKVSLNLEFEFSNPVLRMAVGPVFSQITNTLVDAFCKRAVDVYGRR
ncbi:MAG TPA: type II toxin-antitoxin system RatA family toxin [Candidatus Competibacteraceae bacterium]|nr:type II toxin-antitoxin system RatA family toxin [Candidatus Competibacteraceae bacterium]